MAECELCGKPVPEDDAVEVVVDGMPEEAGVFHLACWSIYDSAFAEAVVEEDAPERPLDDSASPSRRTLVIGLVGLLLGVGVAGIILTLSSDDGDHAEDGRDVAVENSPLPANGSTTSEGLGAEIGSIAPRLVGVSLDGEPVTVSPGNGARQAVVFLAHWCPVCQREVRTIVDLSQRGDLTGIEVAAVVTATSPDRDNYPPSRWLERERWPYPTFADNGARAAANAYGVNAVPTVVLIDTDARVLARLGSLQSDGALRVVRAFVAGQPITAR